jgi:hypothetical protein
LGSALIVPITRKNVLPSPLFEGARKLPWCQLERIWKDDVLARVVRREVFAAHISSDKTCNDSFAILQTLAPEEVDIVPGKRSCFGGRSPGQSSRRELEEEGSGP